MYAWQGTTMADGTFFFEITEWIENLDEKCIYALGK
jgi:hypothetical protein